MTNWPDVHIEAAKGVPFYTPAQAPTAGTARDRINDHENCFFIGVSEALAA